MARLWHRYVQEQSRDLEIADPDSQNVAGDHLVIELQNKLNEPGVIAGRNDAPKSLGSRTLAGIRVDLPGRSYRAEIADWICKICFIKRVKELCSDFNIARFPNGKSF